MTRKSTLSIETLSELGVEKLAQMVFEEIERNAALKKVAKAAIAGLKGPEAVAKLIDRRLSALEKAKSQIGWEKEKAFSEDLRATVATMANELGQASAIMAVERLIRFIATSNSVYQRVDDSYGRLQNIYADAVEALGDLIAKVAPHDAMKLPTAIDAALMFSQYGHLSDVIEVVAKHLPEAELVLWQSRLADLQKQQENQVRSDRDYERNSMIRQLQNARQILAGACGDIDGLIAIEEAKLPQSQDVLGIAEKLLLADRPAEALEWVRREKPGGLRYLSLANLADGEMPRLALSETRTLLEARILDALGEQEAALKLLWSSFEASLSPKLLRIYIKKLPDFEDFDALDKAFAHVGHAKSIYQALQFFLEWPKLDLAGDLVLRNCERWDGAYYRSLAPAALILEQSDQPLAATILYRALLDGILLRSHSKAYGYGAEYLEKLDELAKQEVVAEATAFQSHTNYRLSLRQKHGRKSGFWQLVED